MDNICITDIALNALTHDFMRYVIGAGGVYLIVNVWLAHWLAHRKIRDASPPPGQIRCELLASLRTVLIFATVGTAMITAATAGWVPIYTEIDEYGWRWLVASTLLFIIAHDAWFYWAHWLMHRRGLFRWFHQLHHRSHNPTPFTSYTFDVSEAVVNAIFVPLFVAVVPVHPLALLVFTSHMMLRNALGHCGYEVFPATLRGRPLLDWMTTTTHHDLHHAQPGWNFGLYFTWWDRLMGTEHPRYHAEFARSVRREQAGLTV